MDSSKKLLSADCVALTTISPRPPGFVCPQTGPVLATDACRSAHLLAPAPTRLASPPWRMVGAGERCTARGGARQWRPRRILHLTFRGPDQLAIRSHSQSVPPSTSDQLAIRSHSGSGNKDPHPIPLLRLLVEEGLLLLLLLLFLLRGVQKKFRGKNFQNMNVTQTTRLWGG